MVRGCLVAMVCVFRKRERLCWRLEATTTISGLAAGSHHYGLWIGGWKPPLRSLDWRLEATATISGLAAGSHHYGLWVGGWKPPLRFVVT
ncbi:MAG: hypothetical protein AAF664_04320, partial [Planctomycetota bacterium]